MSGTNRTKADLSPRQAAFVAALVGGSTKEEAAARAEVTPRTGRKWLQLPQVQDAIKAAIGDGLAIATRRAVAAMSVAVAVLLRIMTDPDNPPAVRVSAAGRILESGPKLAELTDLIGRLEVLEEQAKRHNNTDRRYEDDQQIG